IASILHEELSDGQYDKVVVFCQHHSVLDIFREKLEEFGLVGFTGGASGLARTEAIDEFTNNPNTRVFLAQQTAAGIAINLQVAAEVVLVEPSWTPDDNYQAMKRIHRIGQTRSCRARIFAVGDSLDEPIMESVARKMKMQEDIGL
ncbi:MAG: SWF/SNF helicase family protein, partial [Planctomycetes bacterium]|nr:SWF/SNF helicase family protein [Planctomycetota bacterium]